MNSRNHKSHEFTEAIADLCDGYFEWDISDHSFKIHFSANFYDLIGYEASQLPREDALWSKVIHPDDGPDFAADLKSLGSSGSRSLREQTFNRELRFVTKSGSVKWMLCRARFMAGGKTSSIIGTLTDISAIKGIKSRIDTLEQAFLVKENILRAMDTQKQFLAALIDSLPIAMFCKDYESGVGKFVAWNSNAESLWGLKRSAIIGQSDYDFFPKEQADFFRQKDTETLISGKLVHIAEESVDSPTVGHRVVKTWKVPINNGDGKSRFLLGISLDITNEKQLKNDLEVEKKVAIVSTNLASLGELTAGVAHEVNGALASIFGGIDLLRRTDFSGEGRSKLTEIIDIMADRASRISDIVTGLKRAARNNSTDDFVCHSVRAIVSDAIVLAELRRRNETIQLGISEVLSDEMVECRPGQVAQVLLNLLTNSADAITELGDANKSAITITTVTNNDHVIFTVEDSGIGIPAGSEEKIFQAFYTTKAIGQGTGLGLSISRRIAEAHGGHLILERASGPTRFVFAIRRSHIKPGYLVSGAKAPETR